MEKRKHQRVASWITKRRAGATVSCVFLDTRCDKLEIDDIGADLLSLL